jgi:outer membrane receptor protein involved in Fe transport
MTYGSGLRSGFANMEHNPPYTTVNFDIAHEFTWSDAANAKPATVRFDIVNVFDQIYELRDGTSIVFAPQFGARRGFFAGLSQKF